MRRFHSLMLVVAALSGAAAGELGVPVPLAGVPRPENGIYDPGGLIPDRLKPLIAGEISSARRSSGLDLMVVVADKPMAWDPQRFADDLSDRWGDQKGRALVLWIPGETGNPWITVGGMIRSELSGSEVHAISNRARERAKVDPNPAGAIRRALDSLGGDLRPAGGEASRGALAPVRPERRKEVPLKELVFLLATKSKVILFAVAGGLAAVAAAVFLSFRIGWVAQVRLAPKTFPQVSWKRRFGAPHGGISYSYPPRKNTGL